MNRFFRFKHAARESGIVCGNGFNILTDLVIALVIVSVSSTASYSRFDKQQEIPAKNVVDGGGIPAFL